MKEITPKFLADYLESRIPDWTNVEITSLERLPLGASRETYRIDLKHKAPTGGFEFEKLILRRDPPASHVESDRRHEFLSYQTIYGHGIPVPRMILLEEDPKFFDGAISIAEDLRGYQNSEYLLQLPEWREKLPHISRQMWSYMGKLATIDIKELDLSFMRPTTTTTTALQELDKWVDQIDRNELEPEPIARAAIRHLRRNPPTAQKLALVHADFRAGNFLYDEAGGIKAILDWEMAHIGDPLEDLAWSLTRTFSFGHDDRRSGLARKEDAVAIWEKASGLKADPDALAWWELFSSIKGQGLWSSTAAVWARGQNKDIVLAYASWWLRNSQDKAMLELMGKL